MTCYDNGSMYEIGDKMKFDLSKLRKTARADGQKNIDAVLLWTYRWGWTYETALQKLLPIQRRPGSDYSKRGILQKVEPPRGHPPAYCVGSGRLGRALDLFEEETGLAIPYPWPRTAVPFAALGEHQEAAQLIAMGQLGEGGRLKTSREFGDKRGAIPDFSIEKPTGIEWHEVELTPKYVERLFFQLGERDKARAAGEFSRLLFWCRTGGIARNLVAALQQERIPRVIRRGDGKIVRETGVEGWNPAKLLACTEVLLLNDDRAHPSSIGPAQMALSDVDADGVRLINGQMVMDDL